MGYFPSGRTFEAVAAALAELRHRESPGWGCAVHPSQSDHGAAPRGFPAGQSRQRVLGRDRQRRDRHRLEYPDEAISGWRRLAHCRRRARSHRTLCRRLSGCRKGAFLQVRTPCPHSLPHLHLSPPARRDHESYPAVTPRSQHPPFLPIEPESMGMSAVVRDRVLGRALDSAVRDDERLRR